MENLRFAIIGRGRLGGTLEAVLRHIGFNVVVVAGTGDNIVEAARAADFVFVSVNDGAIGDVAKELAAGLNGSKKLPQYIVHTSGATTLAPLEPLKNIGISVGSFHPLQSFTPQSKENLKIFEEVYIAIAGDEKTRDILTSLALQLKAKPFEVPDGEDDRARYHAAACIACNYLVTLMAAAEKLLLPYAGNRRDAVKSLLPLLENTLKNIANADTAIDALTGPISRGDMETTERHKAVLPEELKEMYIALCDATVLALKERKG